MRAVVLEEPQVIRVRDVPDVGAPGSDELLIAPRVVGICGSDVHYYTHGRIGQYILEKPMILGHEAAGIVLEVGSDVQDFQPGDRVAMEPGVPRLLSRATRMGMYNLDPDVRFWATPPVDGCLVERVIHPAAFTYRIPDHMTFGEGALLEPLAVAMHAATRARIKPGDSAVVSGAGTIGLLTAAVLLAGGVGCVLVSDISQAKLDVAAQIPGVVPVDVNTQDLHREVMAVTRGWGADVVVEASGAPSAYADLFTLGAPGNRTVIVGIPVDPVPIDITQLQATETTIETVFRYANDYPRAIDLVAAGKIDLEPFITRAYAMESAVEAFDRVAECHPEDIKVQISMP